MEGLRCLLTGAACSRLLPHVLGALRSRTFSCRVRTPCIVSVLLLGVGGLGPGRDLDGQRGLISVGARAGSLCRSCSACAEAAASADAACALAVLACVCRQDREARCCFGVVVARLSVDWPLLTLLQQKGCRVLPPVAPQQPCVTW